MTDIRICAFCGRPAECRHHLIFGTANRKLADEDGLVIDMCDRHHNMGTQAEKIHGNPAAEHLSKMLGQALWEREMALEALESNKGEFYRQMLEEDARERFTKRYGKSWL